LGYFNILGFAIASGASKIIPKTKRFADRNIEIKNSGTVLIRHFLSFNLLMFNFRV